MACLVFRRQAVLCFTLPSCSGISQKFEKEFSGFVFDFELAKIFENGHLRTMIQMRGE